MRFRLKREKSITSRQKWGKVWKTMINFCSLGKSRVDDYKQTNLDGGKKKKKKHRLTEWIK